MKRLFILFVFSLFGFTLLITVNSLQAQRRDRQPIEEGEEQPQGRASLSVLVDQIQVDVAVMNRKGNLIQGLDKSHFKIYEDKVEQEITHFSPVEAPLTAVMITEFSGAIPWEWIYESWQASYIFVEQMRQDDWIAVVAYDMRPEILVDFTQNKAEVYSSLRRLNTPVGRDSNLYDAVVDVIERVEEVEGKVALVLITSGLDTFSKLNRDETYKKIKSSNVVIYSVSLGGNYRNRYDPYIDGLSRLDHLQADATLRAFAKFTGGHAYFPRFQQEFHNAFSTISAMLRNQYSLGYVSTNTNKDGKYRKITVEVKADIDGDGKADKLKTQHREGYQVAKKG